MERSQEKIKKDILSFLKSHGIMTLATSLDNQPWVCTVYYGMDDDMNLYIVTDPESRHGKQFSKNSKVAFNIFHSHQKVAELKKGIQGAGEIEVVKGVIDVTKALFLWHKFNSGVEYKIKVEDILKKITDTKVFKITPKYLKYFDQELYGTEEYGTLEL